LDHGLFFFSWRGGRGALVGTKEGVLRSEDVFWKREGRRNSAYAQDLIPGDPADVGLVLQEKENQKKGFSRPGKGTFGVLDMMGCADHNVDKRRTNPERGPTRRGVKGKTGKGGS